MPLRETGIQTLIDAGLGEWVVIAVQMFALVEQLLEPVTSKFQFEGESWNCCVRILDFSRVVVLSDLT